MGKLPIGILGPVSGKVGNVVGGRWKGVDYLRAMPASVNNPRTQAQLNQRGRFITMLRFLQAVLGFVRIGFKTYAVKMSPYNAAMSYNIRHGVSGAFPDYSISYDDVLLARGNLRSVSGVSLSSPAPGEVQVAWDDNSSMHHAQSSDRLMVLIYHEAQNDAFYEFNAGVRSDAQLTLQLPNFLSGEQVHVWLALTNLPELIVAGDRNSISNSVYAGSVMVQ